MSTAKQIFAIDATPEESGMRELLANDGHSLSEYIAELCDNSIDAKANKVSITVKATTSSKNKSIAKEIIIADNGNGIHAKNLESCFKMGRKNKLGLRHTGRYGIGLKAACLGMGRKFTLITKQEMGSYMTVVWDTEDTSRANFQLQAWESTDKEVELFKEHIKGPKGTLIKIESLDERVAGLFFDKNVRRKVDLNYALGATYADLLSEKTLTLTYNNSSIKAVDIFNKDSDDYEFLKKGNIQGMKIEMARTGVTQKDSGVFVKLGKRLLSTNPIRDIINVSQSPTIGIRALITIPSWDPQENGVVNINNQKNGLKFSPEVEEEIRKFISLETTRLITAYEQENLKKQSLQLVPQVTAEVEETNATTNVVTLSKDTTSKFKATPKSVFKSLVKEFKDNDFLTHLEGQLTSHHKVYPVAALKPVGDHMEYLMENSMVLSGETCETTGSHEIGTDLVMSVGKFKSVYVSMKSGKPEIKNIDGTKTNTIAISSFRTSAHNGLDEKISHCQYYLNKEDIIISIVETPVGSTGVRYDTYAIDPKMLNLSKLDWTSKVTDSGNTSFKGNGDFLARFEESMSGQLWFNIPQELFTYIGGFTIKF